MSPSLVIQFPVFSIKADLLNHTTAIIAFPMNSTVIYNDWLLQSRSLFTYLYY